jgi:adenylate cyclase
MSLSLWLADAGLRNLPLEELVDGFARRLDAASVPVARIFIGMNALHPMVLARALTWDRTTGPATRFEFQHAEVEHPTMQQSPFAELRGLFMIDWLGKIFPFGELAPRAESPGAKEGVGRPGSTARSRPMQPSRYR